MGSSRIFRTAILKQENLSKHIHTHYGPGVSFALNLTTEQLRKLRLKGRHLSAFRSLWFLQWTVTEIAANEPQLRVRASLQRDSAAPAITGGICVPPPEPRQAWDLPLPVPLTRSCRVPESKRKAGQSGFLDNEGAMEREA